jgi:hypothetical protein
MKAVITAILLALAVTPAVASPEFGNDGDNLCVEYNRGHMWMNAAWESRGEFKQGRKMYTAWTKYGSTDVMITYKEFVKTFEGRIIPMLCQVANR